MATFRTILDRLLIFPVLVSLPLLLWLGYVLAHVFIEIMMTNSLGSVVLLKGGDIKLIIVGWAQLFNNEGTIGYFDYSALGYPQGVIEESNFAFLMMKI